MGVNTRRLDSKGVEKEGSVEASSQRGSPTSKGRNMGGGLVGVGAGVQLPRDQGSSL